jgi:tripartite-type tricarboxylate transporter receptor subunit TctC
MHIKPALAILPLVFAPLTFAQSYPSKPIRFLVGFPPGGTNDIVARALAQKLTENVGQSFVVENRGGANTAIATEVAARAAPDGYTILLNAPGHATNPALMKLAFDSVKDFVFISLAAETQNLVAVHPSFPPRNVRELIAFSKKHPGEINYASSGTGTTVHLSAELFQFMAGIKWVHIPYKGGGPAIVALASGEVDLVFTPYATIAEHVRSGKVRVLAAATRERWSGLPDVPTMAESGYPGVEIDTWFGLFAPAGTPQPVIDTLHAGFAKAAQDPVLVKRLTDQAVEVKTTTPTELAALAASDSARLGKVIDANNIKTE